MLATLPAAVTRWLADKTWTATRKTRKKVMRAPVYQSQTWSNLNWTCGIRLHQDAVEPVFDQFWDIQTATVSGKSLTNDPQWCTEKCTIQIYTVMNGIEWVGVQSSPNGVKRALAVRHSHPIQRLSLEITEDAMLGVLPLWVAMALRLAFTRPPVWSRQVLTPWTSSFK